MPLLFGLIIKAALPSQSAGEASAVSFHSFLSTDGDPSSAAAAAILEALCDSLAALANVKTQVRMSF